MEGNSQKMVIVNEGKQARENDDDSDDYVLLHWAFLKKINNSQWLSYFYLSRYTKANV